MSLQAVQRGLRWSLALVLAAAVAVPSASAWSLTRDSATPSTAQPSIAAWTTDLSPRAFPAGFVGSVHGAAACALGDVTGDGIGDLVVLVQASASGRGASLQALAGPDFTRIVWEKATELQRVLRCAPDLDLDGTLDPIVSTLGEAASTASGAAGSTQHVVQQTLQGATGAALLGRVDAQAVTGVAQSGVAAGQAAASTLLPAAAGAAAYLQTSASAAVLQVPAVAGDLPVPLDAVTATASQAAELQVLDVTGAVVATVSVDEAGIEPLALAPVQLTGAVPDVAVLSQAMLSPVQQAAAGVPELALYAADGTLAWSTQLPASTGVPILVPNAGDLDLDGVGDLIVTTVEQQVQAAPGAAYAVLSGVDGSILSSSGPAVSGLVAALPLGQLPEGPALLEAVQVEGAAQLTLSALDGAGSVLWSVDVDGLAKPANLVLDTFTGDVLGFTDLTGDLVADVAVYVPSGTSLALQVVDGVTGDIAWSLPIPDATEVVPVVIGVAQAAQAAAGGAGQAIGGDGSVSVSADVPGLGDATDLVEETAVGAASSLLAIGTTATEATLTLVDAVSGEVIWMAKAALPPSFDLGMLDVLVAGDLDGDQVQDLLVSALANATGELEDAPVAVVAAVSGSTGNTLWTNATAAAAPASLDFNGTFAPASVNEEEEDGNGIPGPGPALLVAALLAGVLLRRRRSP